MRKIEKMLRTAKDRQRKKEEKEKKHLRGRAHQKMMRMKPTNQKKTE